MLRILLANAVVELLPLLLLVAGIVLMIKGRRAGPGTSVRRYLGISFVSLPVGVFTYIISGIIAASMRGDGHFYSVPFGGYTVSNNAALLASALVWIVLVFLALAAVFRPRQ
jgi:hypothetical protein